MNKVIDLTLFFVQKQCKRQGVELIREKQADLPKVDLDQEKIKQAVLNILLNSLHVLPEGGLVFIRTKSRQDLDFFPDGLGVELTLSDNGPGIHKDDLKFVFDPFFTRSPKGSGLGLSITHSIIEEHGGKIMVESSEGEGASFKIYLPVTGR